MHVCMCMHMCLSENLEAIVLEMCCTFDGHLEEELLLASVCSRVSFFIQYLTACIMFPDLIMRVRGSRIEKEES